MSSSEVTFEPTGGMEVRPTDGWRPGAVNPMRPEFLYIHVPFCARRCSYCDFAVEATRKPPVGEWLDAVEAEARLLAAEQDWGEPLELSTIYVGGGTPSLLGEGVMAELARRLSPYASWGSDTEWTCEANPESFTPAIAQDWRRAGVNRISLGAQTFHAESLRWMGRLHGPEGPGHALTAAREAGFDNVSLDLIFGLPERLGRDWAADLTEIVALEPEHVSLYGLTAEARAPLGQWVAAGREQLANEDRYAEEYLLAHDVLFAEGFEHYEVSNFARPGRRSRHNEAYWTGAPYAALGSGAHAFYPPLRRWNLRSWADYRQAIQAGRLPVEGEEVVGGDAAELEHLWLQLRTDGGIQLDPADETTGHLANLWARAGWADRQEGRLRLTPRGWLLLDRLSVDLEEAQASDRWAATATPIDGILRRGQILANSDTLVR